MWWGLRERIIIDYREGQSENTSVENERQNEVGETESEND